MSSHNTLRFKVEYQDFREVYMYISAQTHDQVTSSQLLTGENMLSEVYYIHTKVYSRKSSVVSFYTHMSSG